MLKICSEVSRSAIGFFVGLALSACATVPQAPPPPPPASSPSSAPVVQKSDPTPAPNEDRPRALASLRLTDQARLLLESGKVNDAITTLERAMNLSPSNGQNYYYLAEAWLKKGNPSQAREFNRLAAMYLRDDPDWVNRVKSQQEKIRMR